MQANRVYTITDVHADKTVTSEDWEVATATARDWFQDPPQEVIDQLDQLENDPDWPHDPHALENMLGLTVEYGPASERE